MDKIKLGKITSAQGIKGEVKVFPYTDTPERFEEIKKLYIGDKPSSVQSVRYMKNLVILKLSAIADRNAAEAARGSMLYLDREDLWDVPEYTYFIEDLIGMDVQDEKGTFIGKLAEVIQNPAQDIYRISREGQKDILLPAVREFVLKADTEKKIMTVRIIEGLAEL